MLLEVTSFDPLAMKKQTTPQQLQNILPTKQN